MPHVDELLGITTLASMGLLAAVSLQPVDRTGAAVAESAARCAVAASVETPVVAKAMANGPISMGKPAADLRGATAKERT